MRGRIRVFAAAASIAALALVVSLVSVSVAGPNVTRLVVVEHATTDTVVDLTTNGDSTGDLLTFHNELFDETDTDVVGTNQGECVRIEVGVSWECRWVNFLEGGSVLAITGGTGAYRGARGSMRLVAANEAGTELNFIFRILAG